MKSAHQSLWKARRFVAHNDEAGYPSPNQHIWLIVLNGSPHKGNAFTVDAKIQLPQTHFPFPFQIPSSTKPLFHCTPPPIRIQDMSLYRVHIDILKALLSVLRVAIAWLNPRKKEGRLCRIALDGNWQLGNGGRSGSRRGGESCCSDSGLSPSDRIGHAGSGSRGTRSQAV